MSRIRRRHNERNNQKQIVQAIKQRLIFVISFLTTVLLMVIFKVGEAWWPRWIVNHQKQMVGVMLLVIICVIILSPIIIEADSNPRALSGPGKNPKGPRLE